VAGEVNQIEVAPFQGTFNMGAHINFMTYAFRMIYSEMCGSAGYV
jgi:hypothetical protein